MNWQELLKNGSLMEHGERLVRLFTALFIMAAAFYAYKTIVYALRPLPLYEQWQAAPRSAQQVQRLSSEYFALPHADENSATVSVSAEARDWNVSGILWRGKKSAAWLAFSGQAPALYGHGADLPGGWNLQVLSPRAVLLRDAFGREQHLKLPIRNLLTEQNASENAASDNAPSDSASAKPPRPLRLADLAALNRAKPQFDAQGNMQGVILSLAPQDILRRYGLEDGDLLISVADVPLNSVAQLATLQSKAAGLQSLTLRLLRKGQELELVLPWEHK